MSLHLITGGNGFVGSALARALLSQGHQVRVIDTHPPIQEHANLQYFQGSILNKDLLAQALQNVEIVHHAAAIVPLIQSPREIEKINVIGTQNVLIAAKHAGVRHFNFLSSSAVYGITAESSCPLTEESPALPFEVYGKSKLTGEELVRAQSLQDSSVSYAILRPRTIIGPGRVGIFDLLFNWIQCGRPIYLIGNGSNSLQLVHVQDFAQACMLAAQKKARGTFNIGAKHFGTLRESIVEVCKHAHSPSRIQPLPISFAVPSLFILNKLHLSPFGSWHYRTFHRSFYFNTTKAEKELGWQALHSNASMLIEAYDWFVKNPQLHSAEGSTHQRPLKRGILSLFMGAPQNNRADNNSSIG